jgi:hypothetical protein
MTDLRTNALWQHMGFKDPTVRALADLDTREWNRVNRDLRWAGVLISRYRRLREANPSKGIKVTRDEIWAEMAWHREQQRSVVLQYTQLTEVELDLKLKNGGTLSEVLHEHLERETARQQHPAGKA